jgi:glutamate synthase (NADPH/NADH) large chain
MNLRAYPKAQGLYDPANERDACGVGFVCDIKNARAIASSSRASRSWSA